MKNFIFLFLLLLQFQSLACANERIDWAEMELNNEYTLNKEISFPGVFNIPAGTKADFMDIMAGEAPIVYMQMQLENCQDTQQVAEMILINPSPEDTSSDRSVAVTLEKDCNLGIFVELKDLYSPSLFDGNTAP
jgi:hypothetical protein